VIVALLLIGLVIVPASNAQVDCEPDAIYAYSIADTIFVQHFNALRNCCTSLTLDVLVGEWVVDFYEGEAGDWCTCICCFSLAYDAHGFAAGHYTVRVWNETGSVLYGETEVDVEGSGVIPTVGNLDRGDCLTPAEVEDEPPDEVPMTWGRIRSSYR
jgi:hypothetical protein